MSRRPFRERQQTAVCCQASAKNWRCNMSDYRDPNDPTWRNPAYDPDARRYNAGWGWAAAAVFIVVVLAIAFGVRHESTQTAFNDVASPTHMVPPSALNPGSPNPATTSLTPRPTPAPLPAPAPGPTPAPQGSQ